MALMNMGWKQSAPDQWVTSGEEKGKFDGKAFTRFQMTARAHEDLQKQLWAKASRHKFGGGMET